MKEKCIIIGCEMLRDEIEHAYNISNCVWPIIWIPRKYHNTPEKLKAILQKNIDELQDYERIIFTFGCCGGGTEGLCSSNTDMTFIGCEDCIHMLLYSKNENKSMVKKGVIYLTNGWTQDDQSIIGQYVYMHKKYGEETCANIMEMMYGNFHSLCVIDTNAYNMSQTIAYAKKAAIVTKLKLTTCKGTTELLEDLFSGKSTGQMVTYKSGSFVKKEDFDGR